MFRILAVCLATLILSVPRAEAIGYHMSGTTLETVEGLGFSTTSVDEACAAAEEQVDDGWPSGGLFMLSYTEHTYMLGGQHACAVTAIVLVEDDGFALDGYWCYETVKPTYFATYHAYRMGCNDGADGADP